MGSPVTSSDFTISNFSGDTCEQLRKLIQMSDTLAEFFAWMFNADGSELSQEFKIMMQDVAVTVGAIIFYPRNSVPAGYLWANGQAVSRTLYANLFAVYGTSYGSGDGSTTFNLPDYQGKFLKMFGPGGLYPIGSSGGTTEETLTVNQIPAHAHGPGSGDPDSAGFLEKTNVAGKALDIVSSGDAVVGATTANTGGGLPHNNLPPYISGVWLVKY